MHDYYDVQIEEAFHDYYGMTEEELFEYDNCYNEEF